MSQTVADLLTAMSVLDNELDAVVGGVDETRAINALILAQHQFEILAAQYPKVFQTSAQTLAVAASTETTAFPSALLRLDALWLLDAATQRPVTKLKRITDIGAHVPALPWPLSLSLATGTGSPAAYYANTADFYWLPLPAGADTIRVYGMIAAAEFVSRDSLFTYPPQTRLPIAAFASKLLSIGVGDAKADLDGLAEETFRPLLKTQKKFDRSEPLSRDYTYAHST